MTRAAGNDELSLVKSYRILLVINCALCGLWAERGEWFASVMNFLAALIFAHLIILKTRRPPVAEIIFWSSAGDTAENPLYIGRRGAVWCGKYRIRP